MKYLTQNKHWDLVKDYNLDKLLYLLIDRPDEIYDNGDIYWADKKDRNYRKYDLPAWCICSVGWISWRKNHEFHRDNKKPAIIKANGYKEYWIDGQYKKEEL